MRSVVARVWRVTCAPRQHVQLMENAEALPALVAEGVRWFADRGTIPYAGPIEVTPRAVYRALGPPPVRHA